LSRIFGRKYWEPLDTLAPKCRVAVGKRQRTKAVLPQAMQDSAAEISRSVEHKRFLARASGLIESVFLAFPRPFNTLRQNRF
jgi:hypothetical protein